MKPGKIWLVRYPYTNQSDYKIRPAVIVSNERFNQAHAFVLACPISSKQSLPEYTLELMPENFHGKLGTQSFVRADNLTAVDKGLFLKEIGSVTPEFLRKVLQQITKNF